MSDQQFDEHKEGNLNSEIKRQYGCPCGKTYLSYPALFTHVKQKHDGKAPGTLIKPKTEKARGRPKLHVDVTNILKQAPQDDMSDGAFNFQQQLQQVLNNVSITYNEGVRTSQGNRTCQDMASSFLNKTSILRSDQRKVLNCFLNELRYFVQKKYGDKFWSQEKPSDIIDVVNQMFKGHEQVKKKYPIPKQTLLDLMYVFFRWMYKSKWTDHKLIKRGPVRLIKPL